MESPEGCVVADTGPLLALARLDGLGWLAELFGRVLIPNSVWAEATLRTDKPEVPKLQQYLKSDTRFSIVADVLDARCDAQSLDVGERAAIGLALHRSCVVLLDDRQARTEARALDLRVIGTLGVLAMAKQKGRISKIAPLIRQLRRSGYFLGDSLVRETLLATGEG